VAAALGAAAKNEGRVATRSHFMPALDVVRGLAIVMVVVYHGFRRMGGYL
jgi:peptidoglycan/LPS O-acetylase OafA/YrhL